MPTNRRQFLKTAAIGVPLFAAAPSLLRAAAETVAAPATPPSTPGGGGVIDWHAHFQPPRFIEKLRARNTPPQVVRDASGTDGRINEAGGTPQPLRPAYTSVDHRLRANDQLGVERQVLSLAGLGAEGLPNDDYLALVQAFNDGIAEVVHAHPDRFSGLAALPSFDLEVAARELERAVRELGLLGALIPVDAFLSLATAQELTPVLQVADRLGAHLFIHPGAWRSAASDPRRTEADNVPFRSNVIDLQGKVASVFNTIAQTDLFKPYARVTVQVANLGGAIPFYVDRYQNVARERKLPDPIPAFRRFYVDSGSQGTRSVELAASVLGADRVLFGTDAPGFSVEENLHAVRATRLSDAEKTRILSTNGLPLLTPRTGSGRTGA